MATTIEGQLRDAAKNPPIVPKDGELRAVDITLLDANPYQPRVQMAAEPLKELMSSIRQSGLLQPIVVKPRSDGKYIIVAGHRRTEAYRRLHTEAPDGERAKYAQIPAVLRLAVDDSQLAVMAFSENVSREGLTPVEEGRALNRLAEVMQVSSNEELAAAVSQPVMRVKRVRRLASAPAFLQAAVETGVLVVIGTDESGKETKERRQLDLNAALAFQSLYEHALKHLNQKPEKAELRTSNSIRRALEGNWPFRRIDEFVKSVLAGKQPLTDTSEPSTVPQPVFEASPTRFVIDLKKFAKATPEQKAALRAALDTLLSERSQPHEEPTTARVQR